MMREIPLMQANAELEKNLAKISLKSQLDRVEKHSTFAAKPINKRGLPVDLEKMKTEAKTMGRATFKIKK